MTVIIYSLEALASPSGARSLQSGVFFDRETFGNDKLAVGLGKLSFQQFLAQAPLSESARATLVQIQEGKVDYLPGLSSDDKKQRLSRMSYEAFLSDLIHADPSVLNFYHARTMGEWGVGTDAVSALDCWGPSGVRAQRLSHLFPFEPARQCTRVQPSVRSGRPGK